MNRILTYLLTIFIFIQFVIPASAADPTYSIYPSKGTVTVGKTFIIDVLIDSAANSVIQARATLLFDPTLVKVVKSEYNASLFCSYPSDQLSVDNKYGVIMLTGFCQSGVGTPYLTAGGADVFARVEFEVLKAGTIDIEWNHNGNNQDFMSVIMKDGSPPTNLLQSKPTKASYTTSGTGSGVKPPTFPDTALNPGSASLIIGVGLIVLGAAYLALGRKAKSNMRTVVLYE